METSVLALWIYFGFCACELSYLQLLSSSAACREGFVVHWCMASRLVSSTSLDQGMSALRTNHVDTPDSPVDVDAEIEAPNKLFVNIDIIVYFV